MAGNSFSSDTVLLIFFQTSTIYTFRRFSNTFPNSNWCFYIFSYIIYITFLSEVNFEALR